MAEVAVRSRWARRAVHALVKVRAPGAAARAGGGAWGGGRGVRGWGGARLFWGLRSGSAGSNNVSHRRPLPAFLTGDRKARPGHASAGGGGIARDTGGSGSPPPYTHTPPPAGDSLLGTGPDPGPSPRIAGHLSHRMEGGTPHGRGGKDPRASRHRLPAP